MQILAMGKTIFDNLMVEKKITSANVEQQDKILFISIVNDVQINDNDKSYFDGNKKNVLVQAFSDVNADTTAKLLNSKLEDPYVVHKAFTREQAKEMYGFIRDNINGKETVLIHCTMGVARSGAVASFIHDYIGGNWEDFKRANNQIQPNSHVIKLLNMEWMEDIDAHSNFLTNS